MGHRYLTAEQVREIKSHISEGVPFRAMAETFQVSKGCIQGIVSGESWAYVPWPDGSLGPMPTSLYQKARDIKRKNRSERHGVNQAPHRPSGLPQVETVWMGEEPPPNNGQDYVWAVTLTVAELIERGYPIEPDDPHPLAHIIAARQGKKEKVDGDF